MILFSPAYLLVIGVTLVISLAASAKVKSAFAKYSRRATHGGRTGADIARQILRDHDIHDVKVEPVAGHLSDHYDPRTKTLRLSEPVYGSTSMAAVGVAAHEVGHAIQHARAYAWLNFRSAWVPVVGIGSNLGMLLIMGALITGAASGLGKISAIAGVILFATTTVFTLITLPVEFDASKRALLALEQGRYVDDSEYEGAKKVLDAAALTYVAAAVGSILTLLYWIWALGLGGRDD